MPQGCDSSPRPFPAISARKNASSLKPASVYFPRKSWPLSAPRSTLPCIAYRDLSRILAIDPTELGRRAASGATDRSGRRIGLRHGLRHHVVLGSQRAGGIGGAGISRQQQRLAAATAKVLAAALAAAARLRHPEIGRAHV